MEPDLSVIYCHDDNNLMTIKYDIKRFRSLCKSFEEFNDEPICIPAKIKYVNMFLAFLDNKIIPDSNSDIIELLKISQFCDISNKDKYHLLNLIRRKIVSRHGISQQTLNKYIMTHPKQMKPFDYETTRYVIQNIDELLNFVCYDSIA